MRPGLVKLPVRDRSPASSNTKNETDDVDAVPNIDLRYVIAFIYPITATSRDFLDDSKHSAEEVDAMYRAWFKSVVLQVTIWSYSYIMTATGD